MASLADIRARLQAQDNKSSGSKFSGDKTDEKIIIKKIITV